MVCGLRDMKPCRVGSCPLGSVNQRASHRLVARLGGLFREYVLFPAEQGPFLCRQLQSGTVAKGRAAEFIMLRKEAQLSPIPRAHHAGM